jgi:hypothetical protein
MKQKIIFTGIIILTVLIFSNFAQQDGFPVLKGSYLGQKPPGMTPEIFAPGIISTESVELNAVFTPDGKEFYFTRKNPNGLYIIMETKMIDEIWSNPCSSVFSGVYEEADPFITNYGKMFFYISKKPDKGSGPPHDILIMNKTSTGWSEPYNPGPPLNSEYNEIYPTMSNSGTLYFNSNRPGGLGKRDIYQTKFLIGSFSDPQNVGYPISSEYDEGDVFIAPDESFIIFTSRDRPDSFGSGDLYICFKSENNSWSEPINMGKNINSKDYDYCPIVTVDGKYFFFSKHGDIYWVDAKIIDELKPEELK